MTITMAATAARADVFVLRRNNSGPIKVVTNLSVDQKGKAQLVASATNDTGLPIQRIRVCVTSPSYKKGCLFTFWSTREIKPGEKIDISLSSHTKIADLSHTVEIAEIEQFVPPAPRLPSKFDPIQALYVNEIGGNAGAMVREQLIAAIVNSGRFIVATQPEEADALIDGRAESHELNRILSSSDSFGSGAAIGAIASIGSSGHSSSQGGTEIVENVALHLTTHTGHSIWAWDGAKRCTQSKAKCAVEDLMFTAR